MTDDRRERLAELLREDRRKKARPSIVKQWAELGVSISPIADGRHKWLADSQSSGLSWSLDFVPDYVATVEEFVAAYDMVAIAGWDLMEEPACLVTAHDLSLAARKLVDLYPDGFIVADSSFRCVLGVDWDEDQKVAFAGIFEQEKNA